MKGFIAITKAMADPQRARILMALAGRELCVCQITELLGLAPSTISRHLSVLSNAGLVEATKKGRWVYYRLAGKEAGADVRGALRWAAASLAESPEIEKDRKRLEKILRIDPEALCSRQAAK